MSKPRLPALRARHQRETRHWAIELAVVAVGVLLALLAAEWAEGRREAAQHRHALDRVDALVARTHAIGAVRVAMSPCALARLAELDAALLAGPGPWRAMPLENQTARMTDHTIFPLPYFVDSIDVPVELFEVADRIGALAALEPERRDLYDRMRQDVQWIAENWQRGWEQIKGLAVLGVDGDFDGQARFALRNLVVAASVENSVAVVRALSLSHLAKAAGIELEESDRALFRERIEFLRGVYGDCVLDIDPATLQPLT